eukprot:scaffold93687_cov78-Phaeocystis_antarctica.AAC.6
MSVAASSASRAAPFPFGCATSANSVYGEDRCPRSTARWRSGAENTASTSGTLAAKRRSRLMVAPIFLDRIGHPAKR